MPKTGVKIHKIKIDHFRRFNDVEFDIGNCITLIAGQNGTSKSTLLGMLCQPFSFGVFQGKTAGRSDKSNYTDNYHGENLAKYEDLTGNPYCYDCEDVFRLSKAHDTIDKDYSYRLHLSGNCITRKSPIYESGLLVRAQLRREKGREKGRIRFVAGPKISSEAGEGNFPHPVIYFGLNRHWPLALVKKMTIDVHTEMNETDREWYIGKYNQILMLDETTNRTEFITADKIKGDFVGISGKDYNSESISAGQDSLGKILTAILSFKRLKSQLGDRYQGGIILIDEIDSTLHAVAQLELLKTLCEAAKEYQLQVIATTHSLFMLKQAFQSSLKNKIKVIYLKREDDHIVDSRFSTYAEIEKNLQVEAQPKARKKPEKVSLIFEDEVGRNMFFAIIGRKLNSYFHHFEMKSLGAGSLSHLATLSLKVPELEKIILIPDGDVKKDIKNRSKNLVFLPGSSRPETLLYECLKTLLEADSFWSKCPADGYSKQVAIIKPGKVPTDSKEAKEWYKDWYRQQSKYWGRSNKLAFTKWAENNNGLCRIFCQEFFKILRSVSSEPIPRELTKRILQNYIMIAGRNLR
jgi:predicted ATPase